MKWKDPTVELPKLGQVVWVMLQHWKKEGAQSIEIYGGQVEGLKYTDGTVAAEEPYVPLRVFNLDYYGQGWSEWNFPTQENVGDCNFIRAWAPVEDEDIPIFLRRA